MTIDSLPTLKQVIDSHGLAARKSLGQNFLLDLNLTAKIARLSGRNEDHDILEIGPGPGGLTRGLLAEGARHILAIEKDDRCLPALADIQAAYPAALLGQPDPDVPTRGRAAHHGCPRLQSLRPPCNFVPMAHRRANRDEPATGSLFTTAKSLKCGGPPHRFGRTALSGRRKYVATHHSDCV